jgi:hypothetical protein
MLTSDAIKKRFSCRTYKNIPLRDEDRQKLNEFLLANVRGPFGNRVRFQIVNLAGREQEEIKTLGTYGFIKGASVFILGAVAKGERDMEDYGYCMEKNILAATHLGLGTCWLGGTFNRSASASRIKKRDDEVVPAITPVGYPEDRKSIMDRAIRFIAKSHSRKTWEELFFQGDDHSPLQRNVAGPYAPALECVRIGPSASNRQPWRVVKDKGERFFHFYVRRTPGYGKIFPDVSLQDIDMGIAMCHFEVAAQEIGRKGGWQRMPDAPPQRGLEYIVSWTEGLGPEKNTGPQ